MRRNKVSTILGRKLRVGRFGLPLWGIGLGAMAIAAVAGQAVGPVLAGSITGSAAVSVGQTVRLIEESVGEGVLELAAGTYPFDSDSVVVVAADDFAATTNDEGSEFMVALQLEVGQTSGFTLQMRNQSGHNASFVLELQGPPQLDIAVNNDSALATPLDDVLQMARMSATSWLGQVQDTGAGDATADINIVVESKDDAAPGYYTIHGRIIQVR